MKPSNIFIIRHGESEANVDKNILKEKPDYACQLTEKGRKQAFAVGEKIGRMIHIQPSTYAYISPYWRTRQTYLEIKKSLKIEGLREDPRIREQEWGTKLWDGTPVGEEERDGYGHFYYRINGGESCADVYDRCSDFMGSLYRDFEKESFPDNVIIVCHGMTLRVLLMRWLKLSVEQFEILKNPKNCQFHRLVLKGEKYELVTKLDEYEKYNHNYQFPDLKELYEF